VSHWQGSLEQGLVTAGALPEGKPDVEAIPYQEHLNSGSRGRLGPVGRRPLDSFLH
jgi:hypothetical protein